LSGCPGCYPETEEEHKHHHSIELVKNIEGRISRRSETNITTTNIRSLSVEVEARQIVSRGRGRE